VDNGPRRADVGASAAAAGAASAEGISESWPANVEAWRLFCAMYGVFSYHDFGLRVTEGNSFDHFRAADAIVAALEDAAAAGAAAGADTPGGPLPTAVPRGSLKRTGAPPIVDPDDASFFATTAAADAAAAWSPRTEPPSIARPAVDAPNGVDAPRTVFARASNSVDESDDSFIVPDDSFFVLDVIQGTARRAETASRAPPVVDVYVDAEYLSVETSKFKSAAVYDDDDVYTAVDCIVEVDGARGAGRFASDAAAGSAVLLIGDVAIDVDVDAESAVYDDSATAAALRALDAAVLIAERIGAAGLPVLQSAADLAGRRAADALADPVAANGRGTRLLSSIDPTSSMRRTPAAPTAPTTPEDSFAAPAS